MTPGGEAAEVGDVRRGLPSLRTDRRLWGWAAAHGVSEVGDEIFYVALVFTAAKVASPTLAGMIVAVAVAPRAVVSLFAGAAVDRLEPRRVMLWSDVSQIVVLVGAVSGSALGGPSVGVLIALGLSFGLASAFYGPAAFSFPRQLRPREDLTRVAGVRQFLGRAAAVGGPPLGGVIVAATGLAGALLVDAVSFALIAVVLVVVRPRMPLSRQRGPSVLADVRAGLGHVAQTPHVRDLVISLAGLNVFLSPVVSVGIALRSAEDGWGPAALGLLMGAIGAGAAVGTLAVIPWRPQRPIYAGLLLIIVQPFAMAMVGFAAFPAMVAAMAMIGLSAGLASPLLSGAFQATVDEEYLGRTSSITSLADDTLVPLALAGFGALAGLVNLTIACLVFASAFLLQLIYSLSRTHLRDLAMPEPEKSMRC
ncbi:MAG: MFS transporter [Actinomycetota bacterium]|nr:MFS transporter [Actinomycetota bacterium]